MFCKKIASWFVGLVQGVFNKKAPVVSLMESIKLSLGEFHLSRIKIIDDHDFTGVIAKVKEEARAKGRFVTDQYLQSGILALKQYYAVAMLDPRNEHAVSDQVDPFWHAHILHTRVYEKFCADVYGQFIHHEPLDHGSKSDVSRVASLYRHTQEVYSRVFSKIDRKFYPVKMPAVRLVCKHYEVLNPPIREVGLFPALSFGGI